MWYNVIPLFVLLNPSLYPTYPIRTKGLDSSIFRNYTCYVLGNVYPIPKQHVVPPTYIPNSIGNQFPIMVQLVINKDKQPIQQHVPTLMPTTIQVTTSLLTYVPKHSDHQPSNGRQPRDSHGGSSLGGDPLRELPFNPPIASFGWPALDPHMFIPPWYQPPIVQLVLKPITKPPYKKLQYPTYVKDDDPNVHIRIFENIIKANGETIEANIINRFGFTFKDNISKWGENYIPNHPNCIFEKLKQTFCK